MCCATFRRRISKRSRTVSRCAPRGRRRQARPAVARHPEPDRRSQFQSVLDRAGLDRAARPHSEDAGGAGLPDQEPHPHPRCAATSSRRRRSTGTRDEAIELPLQAGSRRFQFARLDPHQFPERSTASTCTTRRPRTCSATISASIRPAACACRMFASSSSWLLMETPGWSRQDIDAVIRSASARTPGGEAGSALLGLCHRLGDARRRRASSATTSTTATAPARRRRRRRPSGPRLTLSHGRTVGNLDWLHPLSVYGICARAVECRRFITSSIPTPCNGSECDGFDPQRNLDQSQTNRRVGRPPRHWRSSHASCAGVCGRYTRGIRHPYGNVRQRHGGARENRHYR